MIEFEFLQKLIKAVDESGVDFIEIERGGTRVRLGKTPPAAAVTHAISSAPHHAPPQGAGAPAPGEPAAASGGTAQPAAPASNLLEVKSPMVGTFYRGASPSDPPYVDIGTRVSKGDALCIIEAMKLMNELEAEIEGSVVEVCVENGEPVEYGQVLFRVQPA